MYIFSLFFNFVATYIDHALVSYSLYIFTAVFGEYRLLIGSSYLEMKRNKKQHMMSMVFIVFTYYK